MYENTDSFRHLAEALPQLVWTADSDGNLDYISPQMGEFAGTEPHDSDYLNWAKLIHPDDLEELDKVWTHSLETGETYVHEFRMRGKDGTYHWFSGRAIPVVEADGTIVKWYGATTNIDELKEAELTLRNAAAEKDRFIATLGHELRNPLSAISNSYHTLVHDGVTEEIRAKALDSLGRQLKHLSRLVDETLDISRLVSGKFRLLPTRLELNHLVEGCVSDMEHACTENKITLTTETSGEDIWMKADSVRLAQCIYNLLNNAVKFTKPGGAIHVGCRLDPVRNFVEIKVADNGVGMTEEEIARIFKPFSQGRSAGRLSREGLGLGLAITSEIIGLHGGEITVASDGKGKGSTFSLNIPVGSAPEKERKEIKNTPVASAPQESLRVLLVDDDESVTATLKMFLELDGHSVTVVHCGRTAFAAIDRELPDVVFCDISLPGTIKGWDVARRVAQNYPHDKAPYTIALSGHADAEHAKKCLEAGFDEHIPKPPSPDALREALGRVAMS
ncbi:MAG: ATP-binding protein [Luteolibacter sp.]